MPFDISQAIALTLERPVFPPAVKGWKRLEGRPRAVDFERALRAEVRDALWFLTRQWQFGEFRGEDAGSPIEVRTAVRCAPLQHYAARGEAAVAYDRAVPLEVRVEKERVPADLITQTQISRAFFAPLRALPQFPAIRALYLNAYPLLDAVIDGVADERARQLLLLARGHVFDGRALLADVPDGDHAGLVAGFTLPAAVKTALLDSADVVAAQFALVYEEPAAGAATAWAPSYLEYQFAVAAEAGNVPQTVLTADQYANGRLDWYGFNIDTRASLAREHDGFADAEARPLSFLPAPISFAGMPTHRYWEMENRRIEFADIDAQTRDVAKLLLTEFTLIYGNDWCVLPFEVAVGSLCEVLGVLVTDTFGEKVLVSAAGRGSDDVWQRWTLFTLSTNAEDGLADTRLFLPPAVPGLLEGPALERVVFLRDEMANFAWAVQRTVPGASGAGVDGYAVARAAAAAAGPPPAPPLHETKAPVRYELGTDVPGNWRPFIPVHVPGSNRRIQFQRARMPGPGIALRGEILNPAAPDGTPLPAYYIHEEEIPRAGRVATRSVQRARWLDGRTFTWVGRRVSTGKGEGSSGLVFDQVVTLKSEGA